MNKVRQYLKDHELEITLGIVGASFGIGAVCVAIISSKVGARTALETIGRKELVVDVQPRLVAEEITKYLNNYQYRIDERLPQQILNGIKELKMAEKAAKAAGAIS